MVHPRPSLPSPVFLVMSAPSDQVIIQAVSQIITKNYASYAVICKFTPLAIYEVVITFADEIRIVWKKPITASAILLGSVRWCMILTASILLVPTTLNFRDTKDLPYRFVWTIRGSLVLADTIVLVSTWVRTFGHWRQARRANATVSLTACLLRDGTIYFIVLLALNIAQLLTVDASADVAPLTPFIAIMPLVLINRFMINLRIADTGHSESSFDSDGDHNLSTPQFRGSTNTSFLGNIGETLQDGWDGSFQADSLSGGDGSYSGESYALRGRAVSTE
ncbi:uncharacterized protein PHACADRAFT_206566 [Phanerochaete carnosa HHB-10118-sp]|uniref:DUF6533 domain-containing protein n=1 Tax=Phanerochaete carnosa (strain HHB-10118-sp) TaxID=650164 RepID=K5V4X7_PHACS|nr:uncharacterized protein PHACADRAFT_206566 [Phanerochaete carnosa HHB-10118-sp]EKM57686.1 hypothetical protein PHACADRAFT_206566 [Phanerochaete carnosa HHB-10118-sp]